MLKKILYTVTAALLIAAFYLVFVVAPIPINPASAAGDANNFKIFYFHLPIAISAYLAFAAVFISSIAYLKTRDQKWDIIALSSAHIGVIFALLTLISGSIWARSAWGEYWVTWDVRLNTSLVLFLIYLSYIMVRQAIEEPEKRARLSSVFGIVGFIGVPLSYMSIRVWNRATIHPQAEFNFSLGPLMITLLVNFAAYFLLAISLVLARIEYEKLKEESFELKRKKGV